MLLLQDEKAPRWGMDLDVVDPLDPLPPPDLPDLPSSEEVHMVDSNRVKLEVTEDGESVEPSGSLQTLYKIEEIELGVQEPAAYGHTTGEPRHGVEGLPEDDGVSDEETSSIEQFEPRPLGIQRLQLVYQQVDNNQRLRCRMCLCVAFSPSLFR